MATEPVLVRDTFGLLHYIYEMQTTRDFTATTFVVHDGKVLLHRHHKLHKILPPGGHVEIDELPDDAAVREVREESGFDIQLFDPEPHQRMGDVRRLVRPIAVLLEDISPSHQHIDLIYFGTIVDRAATSLEEPRPEKTAEFFWVDRSGLEDPEIPENVRVLALDALDTLDGGRNPAPGRDAIGPPVRIAVGRTHRSNGNEVGPRT